ncbi:alpha/beta fold hydrolase [Bowmanella denitrificans]|uniref:alpha/beta fold hydrolase n=1 Tax=Bowmanella denitrificans TaxID=366582 RepID=UPI000C9A7AB4|nr:alpha/beta hydrolase [Bowmanella denitrificans]
MQGVYISGNPQGPAVVLLHSSMSSARQWRELAGQLEQDFYILNIDLLGYGQAPKVSQTGAFSLATESERIRQHLHELGVTRFHLVGHSFGGAIALKLAYELKPMVMSLAVFEPVAFHLLDKQHPGFLEVQALGNEVSQLSAEQAAARFVNYWNGSGYFSAMPQQVQQGFIKQVEKVRLDFVGLMGEPYGLNDYAKICCPVLLLSGRDTRDSAKAVAQSLCSALPHLTYQQVSGGHMAPISHSAEVNTHLFAFLASQLQ